MLKPLLTIVLLSACSTSHAAPSIAPSPPVAKAEAPSSLPELAARRAQMIGWLRDYREAGQYPTDASGRVASVFVGANGVRCPMAELLHKSGRGDLVAAVAKDNNTVRLADVREGPLFDWMLSSGLTLDEINLVQGIARIDYGWMNREIQIEGANVILAGKAQVRGKIESVEMALRDNTKTSLVIAQKRLPANRTVDDLATAPIVDAVVAKPTQAEIQALAKREAEAQREAQRARTQAVRQVLLQSRGGLYVQGMN
jgi:hypothetical protein